MNLNSITKLYKIKHFSFKNNLIRLNQIKQNEKKKKKVKSFKLITDLNYNNKKKNKGKSLFKAI